MRLLKLENVKAGQKLEVALKKSNGSMVMPAGAALTDPIVERLVKFGISHAYVQDDEFSDVEVVPALSESIREEVMSTIAGVFAKVDKGCPIDSFAVRKIANKIYDTILEISDKPIDLFSTYVVEDARAIHSIDVACMICIISLKLEKRRDAIIDLIIAGLLHDINLKDMKEEENSKHAEDAMAIIKAEQPFNAVSYISVLMHHEYLDGSGGPRHYKADKVYEGAKVLTACDVYDNLVSGYCKTEKMTPTEAIFRMSNDMTTKLDSESTSILSKWIAIYPAGATVILNDSRKAVVLSQNRSMPSRPIIKICNANGKSGDVIDMLWDSDLMIESMEI